MIRPVRQDDQADAYRIWVDGICGAVPVRPMTNILATKVPLLLTLIAMETLALYKVKGPKTLFHRNRLSLMF